MPYKEKHIPLDDTGDHNALPAALEADENKPEAATLQLVSLD